MAMRQHINSKHTDARLLHTNIQTRCTCQPEHIQYQNVQIKINVCECVRWYTDSWRISFWGNLMMFILIIWLKSHIIKCFRRSIHTDHMFETSNNIWFHDVKMLAFTITIWAHFNRFGSVSFVLVCNNRHTDRQTEGEVWAHEFSPIFKLICLQAYFVKGALFYGPWIECTKSVYIVTPTTFLTIIE